MNNTLSQLSVEALRTELADAIPSVLNWDLTWICLHKLTALAREAAVFTLFSIDTSRYSGRVDMCGPELLILDSCWPIHTDLLLLLYSTLAVNEILCSSHISYTTVCGCVCPIQRFIALSVQLCGDYAAHRAALYQHTACVLPLITVVDSCFCDYDHFSPAQWKDCLKVELVEAQRKVWKETGCFHITQDIPLIFLFFRDLSLQCTPVRRLWHVHNHTLFHCCLQHQLNSYTHNTL